ncbi:MAG: (2Fe-2S)-binding protein [Halanaerobiales bacterium]|nr:(2Fe-2S)-binding protein [Halanaerobiales bacterium]
MENYKISFVINSRKKELEVPANMTLLEMLREKLGLTGTKCGCGGGECGACTVIMNNKAVNSCLVLAPEVDDSEIFTVEGLAQGRELDVIQEAFVENSALQCGYCTPGMIMSAKALLTKNPNPTDEEIREGISGNLCRCTGYEKIVEAIKCAAEKMRG